MLDDPVDAPWRLATLDVMRHVLLLKTYHLVDATWSLGRLVLSVSKIDSHEQIDEEAAQSLAHTIRLTVMDRCPQDHWKKLNM